MMLLSRLRLALHSGNWRWLAHPTLLLGLLLGSGSCGIKAPSLDTDILGDAGTLDVRKLLAELFPELTEAELGELAAKLNVEAALALKVEIGDIRKLVDTLSRELADAAKSRTQARKDALAGANDGFPTELAALGSAAFYDASKLEGRIDLTGVFSNHTPIKLANAAVKVTVNGTLQTPTLDCIKQGGPVDIVFLVDITGSMSSVIKSVRRSLNRFVDAIVASQVQGTISVVTFQDSVGVNVSFQEGKPKSGYERSPFFKPVPIADAARVEELQRFVTRLEANSGADMPENLAAALDFARNNVIGVTSNGAPNVIGDGVQDPADVAAWPTLTNSRQVFVAFTDAPFHSDSRTPTNSSLKSAFKPRPIADILKSLQRSGTVVHVSDPSWVDHSTAPNGGASEKDIDSDFWALQTGGLGEDKVLGYSLVDLDLVVVAEETGLLDIALDGILASSCSVRFPLPTLAAGGVFSLELTHESQVFKLDLTPTQL